MFEINILLLLANAVLLTLIFQGAKLARNEFEKTKEEVNKTKCDAVELVSAVHEAHTSLAEQVVALTKKSEDLKQTVQLLQMQVRK